MDRKALRVACVLSALGLFQVVSAIAETPPETLTSNTDTVFPKAYDGFQASRDAQLDWDARRVDAINRQLGWNELMRFRAATPEPSTLYYSPYVPLALDLPWQRDVDAWPYGVGRIYGYGYYEAVRQPIGRREVQTGPNRWESFPIYAEDVERTVVPLAPPKIEAPPPPPKPQGREF